MCVWIVDLPSSPLLSGGPACQSVDVVLGDAVKSLWLCSKETLTLFWELSRVLSRMFFLLWLTQTVDCHHFVSGLILWRGLFHPPHLIHHIQIARFKEKLSALWEVFSSAEIIQSFYKGSAFLTIAWLCEDKSMIIPRDKGNVAYMEENHLMESLYLYNQNLHQFCTLERYHRNRLFVIIQFCHTRRAWIVCIISLCGQCEAICCKITSILPAGWSLTVCPDCLCSLIIHSLRLFYLKVHAGLLFFYPEGHSAFCPSILMTLTWLVFIFSYWHQNSFTALLDPKLDPHNMCSDYPENTTSMHSELRE